MAANAISTGSRAIARRDRLNPPHWTGIRFDYVKQLCDSNILGRFAMSSGDDGGDSTAPQVAAQLGISMSALWSLNSNPQFPQATLNDDAGNVTWTTASINAFQALMTSAKANDAGQFMVVGAEFPGLSETARRLNDRVSAAAHSRLSCRQNEACFTTYATETPV